MTDAPFFEPWPDPEVDDGYDNPDIDLPWMPPVHVAGVVVPVAAEAYRGDDAVVRVTHVVAFQRGLEVHVETRLRPGTRRPVAPFDDTWRAQEPRIGILLADGTRLGHRPPHGPPAPDLESTTASLTQLQGHGGGLHFSSGWWLSPFPVGDALQVVVEWEHQGVPESSVRVELGTLREAAARETVLWDPPPEPEEGYFGWAGYSPSSGEASGWSPTPPVDDEDDGHGPDAGTP
jgi:hypothetical protein